MVASWSDLRKRFSTEGIRLRYIFAGLFSTSDTALRNSGAAGARHSAEFASFVSRADLTEEMVDASIFRDRLRGLQSRSGLDEALFMRFLADLELKDERELLAKDIDNFPSIDREKIKAIRDLLPALVRTSNPGQAFSEEDLVDRLGWRSRLNQANSHVFPVPMDYHDNETTERTLLNLINRTPQGYIC